ncbi:MAG: hypothetical protein BWZ10_03051 [candidate division BRC1 bacterium ADurb.BinA364]|nr:MAG: hypothetical protein BWZ10_03051 [candidate division BRC1 bacterium ADurb.BinA364]
MRRRRAFGDVLSHIDDTTVGTVYSKENESAGIRAAIAQADI